MRRKKIILSILVTLTVLFSLWMISMSFPGKMRVIDQPRRFIMKKFIETVDTCDRNIANVFPAFTNKYTQNAIPFEQLSNSLDSLVPGTLVISEHGKSICSLIPGKWKHAMIYLGTQEQTKKYLGESSSQYQLLKPYYATYEYLILDSRLHYGVYIHDMTDLADLKTKSTMRKMAFFIPKDKTATAMPILNFVFGELGKEYDLDADLHKDKYYCSELIYQTLIEVTHESPVKIRVFPKTIVSPRDAYKIALEINDRKNIFWEKTIDGNLKN